MKPPRPTCGGRTAAARPGRTLAARAVRTTGVVPGARAVSGRLARTAGALPATRRADAVSYGSAATLDPGRVAGGRRSGRGARAVAAVAVLAAGMLVTACGAGAGNTGDVRGDVAPRVGHNAPPAAEPAARTGKLPGVGPRTLAGLPLTARQVVLVTGAGPDATTATVRLYDRAADGGWQAAGPRWPAHNAAHGWTFLHQNGDLRSPVGVFGLTDAGGRLPNPGTRLPYDHAPAGFVARGTGVDGESLRGAFDYVIAINYNRTPGVSPRDWTRPLGEARGGGIWLHVDHGGPTEGCVSLPATAMRTLLRTLDPARHPVVVMGDAPALSR